MKRMFWIMAVAVLASPAAYAVSSGKQMRVDGGDTPTMSRTVIPFAAGTAVVISTYSSTRVNLQCHNSGSNQVYVGNYSNITANATGTYVIEPSTFGTTSWWQTNSTAQFWAIAGPGGAGSTLFCHEDR